MRNLLIFSQNNPLWKDLKFGDFPADIRQDSTFGRYGCLDTVGAMLASYYGKKTDPVLMNRYMIDNKLYVNGNLMPSDDWLSKIFPDIKYERTYHYENTPADLPLLHSLMDDPTISIYLKVDMPGVDNWHFVLCVECHINGTTVLKVADPIDGTLIDFVARYGSPEKMITKMVVYSGIPATSQQEATQNISVQLNLVKSQLDEKTRLLEQSQGILHERDVRIQELQTADQEKTNANIQLNDSNRKLIEEKNALNGKLENAFRELSAYHGKDKTEGEEGLVAKDHEQEYKDAVQKIGEGIGIEGEFSTLLHYADAVIAKYEESEKRIEELQKQLSIVNTIGTEQVEESVKEEASQPQQGLASKKVVTINPLLSAMFRFLTATGILVE